MTNQKQTVNKSGTVFDHYPGLRGFSSARCGLAGDESGNTAVLILNVMSGALFFGDVTCQMEFIQLVWGFYLSKEILPCIKKEEHNRCKHACPELSRFYSKSHDSGIPCEWFIHGEMDTYQILFKIYIDGCQTQQKTNHYVPLAYLKTQVYNVTKSHAFTIHITLMKHPQNLQPNSWHRRRKL